MSKWHRTKSTSKAKLFIMMVFKPKVPKFVGSLGLWEFRAVFNVSRAAKGHAG